MPYFLFSQNNSGGKFVVDDDAGLGPEVWIQARNINEATSRAREIGIYFNGVDKGRDCRCCGDRWDIPYGYARLEPIIGKGDFHWHRTVYVHGIDGGILRVHLADK